MSHSSKSTLRSQQCETALSNCVDGVSEKNVLPMSSSRAIKGKCDNDRRVQGCSENGQCRVWSSGHTGCIVWARALTSTRAGARGGKAGGKEGGEAGRDGGRAAAEPSPQCPLVSRLHQPLSHAMSMSLAFSPPLFLFFFFLRVFLHIPVGVKNSGTRESSTRHVEPARVPCVACLECRQEA